MRWVGLVECMEAGRGAYWVLVGKLKRRRPLGRTVHARKDDIKIDLQEVGWGVQTGLV
jgi:hypothetical protein